MKLLLLIFIFISTYLLPQTDLNEIFKDKSEVYFKFSVSSHQELQAIGEIISIDNVKFNMVYAYANRQEFEKFLKLNIDFVILPNPSTLVQPEMSNLIEEIKQWNVYPTYDAYVNMMYQFQSNFPHIFKIIDAGTSVQGRKILFAKITDNVNIREPEPQFMYTSTMHGDETTGYVLMLRLIDSLLNSYNSNQRIANIINNVEIWINPLANPDGTYRSGNNTVSGATRGNFNNFDLNRNFPDPVNGVHPNQQIETTRFRAIQEANNFSLIANFHGGAEVINYPWDRWSNVGSNSRIHADQSWYQFISRLYADTAQFYSPPGYMTQLSNGITNGGAWYVITGGRQDYTNWYRNGREVTAEISNTKLPPASQLPLFWEYNKRSLLNYIEHVFYGIKGVVTDTIGNPIRAKITVIGRDYDRSEVFSDSITGFYLRMIQPGSYSLKFEAPGYFDFISDLITIPNYYSSFTLNVRMIPTVPIPVELISFYASVDKNNVELNWSTATELNNKGFEIQRAVYSDLNKAQLEWNSIAFINGYGTSSEIKTYSYIDKNLNESKYFYRLKQIDLTGDISFSKHIEVDIKGIYNFSLEQNYPNPFNPTTKIRYSIPSYATKYSNDGILTILKVYDILGNEIKTLVNEKKSAGVYEVDFDANQLSTGIYFYKISMLGDGIEFNDSKKMIIIR